MSYPIWPFSRSFYNNMQILYKIRASIITSGHIAPKNLRNTLNITVYK